MGSLKCMVNIAFPIIAVFGFLSVSMVCALSLAFIPGRNILPFVGLKPHSTTLGEELDSKSIVGNSGLDFCENPISIAGRPLKIINKNIVRGKIIVFLNRSNI